MRRGRRAGVELGGHHGAVVQDHQTVGEGVRPRASFELPVPATYIIGTDRRVVWRFAHPDYTRRAEPADVLAALDRLHGASA